MTREEIIRNLKYTMEKHKNDTVSTFDTNISVMCRDILDYLEQEQTRDEKLIDAIDFAIKATDSQDDYCMGMRNGMRCVKYLIDGKEPQYETRQEVR